MRRVTQMGEGNIMLIETLVRVSRGICPPRVQFQSALFPAQPPQIKRIFWRAEGSATSIQPACIQIYTKSSSPLPPPNGGGVKKI